MDKYRLAYKIYEEVWNTFQRNSLVDPNVSREDLEKLHDACGNDLSRLRRYIKRRVFGERVSYILGYEEFCGRRYQVDRRVYVPDKDSVFLVDSVVALAEEIFGSTRQPVIILEVGVGCGCLAISIQTKLEGKAKVVGVDVDGSALEVASDNIKNYDLSIELYESDVFESVPKAVVPNVIYSNPPWGNDDPTHYDERPLTYFLDMPRIASFAVDGVTELHESIISQERERQWGANIMLYNGVMDERIVNRLGRMTTWSETIWFSNQKYSLLHCRNQGG